MYPPSYRGRVAASAPSLIDTYVKRLYAGARRRCGPGVLVEYLPGVDYTGTDPSEAYIGSRATRYGDRGRFFVGRVDDLDADESEPST